MLLANLPKLEKLSLENFEDTIGDDFYRYFTKLKSLELLEGNVTNAALSCISSYCLELQSLKIDREF